VEPYCSKEGNWKFALSEAKIDARIRIDFEGLLELTPEGVRSMGGNCADYDRALQTLHVESSVHYPLMGDPAEPVNPSLPPHWKSINSYYQRAGIMAHERIHYERFQKYTEEAFSKFKKSVDDLANPIRDGDAPSAAKDRIADELKELVTTMENDTHDKQLQAEGGSKGHSNPDEFYNASMEAMIGIIRILLAARPQDCLP